MNNLNLSQFKEILISATKQIMEEILSSDSVNNIVGFSLYSDDSASSISSSYNTRNFLVKQTEGDPDESFEYYKWYPAEWEAEGIKNQSLDALSKSLFEISTSDEMSESNFIEYKNKMYEAMVEVLENLKNNDYFKSFPSDFILVFYVTDTYDTEKEISWIKRLNNHEQYMEFKEWRESLE